MQEDNLNPAKVASPDLQLVHSLQKWSFEVSQEKYQPILVNASLFLEDDVATAAQVGENLPDRSMPLMRDKKLNFYRPRFHHSELKIKSEILLAILINDHSLESSNVSLKHQVMEYINLTNEMLFKDYNLDVYYFHAESEDKTRLAVSFSTGRSLETIAVNQNVKHTLMLKYFISKGRLKDYSFFFLMNDRTLLSVENLFAHLQQMTASDFVFSTIDLAEVRAAFTKNDSILNHGLLLSSSALSQCAIDLLCLETRLRSDDDSRFYTSHPTFSFLQSENMQLQMEAISRVITTFPIVFNSELYHRIHLLNAHRRIPRLKLDLVQIESKLEALSNSSRWPPGVFAYQKGKTRYEIFRWGYWNSSHTLMPNDIQVVRPLTGQERGELKHLERVCGDLLKANLTITTVYRKFDAVRGLEYLVDVTDSENQLRRLQVVKPLNPLELITDVPYVTENMHLTMVLPVRGGAEVPLAIKFLRNYANVCLKQPNHATVLAIVLIYSRHLHLSDSIESALELEKREFSRLKKVSLYIQSKFAANSVKIVFLDLTPPDPLSAPAISSLPSAALATFPSELAYLDLIVRSLSASSTEPFLMLHCRSNMLFSMDFLNRVRLNTISGRQIFLPIPFVEYRFRTMATNSMFQKSIHQSSVANDFIASISKFAKKEKESLYFDVRKENGYFDQTNYELVAFFLSDYLAARQSVEQSYPIVRNHQSIVKNQHLYYNASVDLKHLFSGRLAHMRAVEPELRLYHSEILQACEHFESNVYAMQSCANQRLFGLGPKQKLASIVMEYLEVKKRNSTYSKML